MENQTDLKELLAALCKAQSEYPDIPKTRTGQEGNRKFKYADLNDIHKATRAINAKNGLSTPHETTDTHLITRLYHSASGQCLKTQLPIKFGENPKHTGALLTYLKRYNIQSLLDISTEEDLDSVDLAEQKTQSIPSKPTPIPEDPKPQVSEAQLKRLFAISSNKGWSNEDVKSFMRVMWDIDSSKDLNRARYDILCGTIEKMTFEEAMLQATQ